MTNKDFREVERDLHALLRAVNGSDKVCRNYNNGMLTLEETIREVFRLNSEQDAWHRG